MRDKFMSNFIRINISLTATHNNPQNRVLNLCFINLFRQMGNLTVNAELDPDVNFFQSNSSRDTKYFSTGDSKT